MKNPEKQLPKPFEIYRHFKGNLYQILNIATHSETGESLVIYQALYGDFGVYARPLDMFLSEVDKSKYPDAKEKFRFTKADVNVKICNAEASDRTVADAAEETPLYSSAPEQIEDDQQKRAGELFIEFLDEDDFAKKRNILKAISGIATESMINNMAASLDLVATGTSRDGDIKLIDDYIRARIHFDGGRLRN